MKHDSMNDVSLGWFLRKTSEFKKKIIFLELSIDKWPLTNTYILNKLHTYYSLSTFYHKKTLKQQVILIIVQYLSRIGTVQPDHISSFIFNCPSPPFNSLSSLPQLISRNRFYKKVKNRMNFVEIIYIWLHIKLVRTKILSFYHVYGNSVLSSHNFGFVI